jgi:hypothetical protein
MRGDLLLVPGRRHVHGRVESGALLLVPIGVRRRGAALFLDWNSGALGERAYGLRERIALDLLEEAKRVAALLAAEAMVEARVRIDIEARRLLLVKRTEADEPPSPLLEGRDALGDDGDKIRAVAHERDRVLRNHRPAPDRSRGLSTLALTLALAATDRACRGTVKARFLRVERDQSRPTYARPFSHAHPLRSSQAAREIRGKWQCVGASFPGAASGKSPRRRGAWYDRAVPHSFSALALPAHAATTAASLAPRRTRGAASRAARVVPSAPRVDGGRGVEAGAAAGDRA